MPTPIESSTLVEGLPPTESSQPPGRSAAPAPRGESSHLSAIIGGALSGVVAMGLLLAALWRLCKRDSPTKNSSRRSINPFTASVSSAGVPVTPWRLEKLGAQQNRSLPIEGDNQPAISVSASSLINSSSNNVEPTAGVRGDTVRPAAIPTDPLVTVLNAWLQTRQWDGGEAPPEYPVANASPQDPS